MSSLLTAVARFGIVASGAGPIQVGIPVQARAWVPALSLDPSVCPPRSIQAVIGSYTDSPLGFWVTDRRGRQVNVPREQATEWQRLFIRAEEKDASEDRKSRWYRRARGGGGAGN